MRTSFLLKMTLVGALFAGAFNMAQAQTKIKDNTIPGTSLLPRQDALLELESSQRGFLPPRMDSITRNKLTDPNNPNGVPDSGLVIYDTDDSCLDVYDGTHYGWESLCALPSPANFIVSPTITTTWTVTNEDYLALDITTAGDTLYLPDASSPNPPEIGHRIFVSNIGSANMTIWPQTRLGATNSFYLTIKAGESEILMYLGGSGNGSWDCVSGS